MEKDFCPHEVLEKLEEDEEEGGTVWARCAKCFVLFKISKESWEKNYTKVES